MARTKCSEGRGQRFESSRVRQSFQIVRTILDCGDHKKVPHSNHDRVPLKEFLDDRTGQSTDECKACRKHWNPPIAGLLLFKCPIVEFYGNVY